jgi:7-dehydrocholesterol reductase
LISFCSCAERRQRQEFRATNGKQKVWGKEPDYIVAKYTTKDGEVRSSLLLCSGWWSLARYDSMT